MEGRPQMWTGELSLKSMHTYCSGYYMALLDHKIVVLEPFTICPFFDWVANKLGYYESTAGWANMILACSMGFNTREIHWEEFFKTPVSAQEHTKSIKLFYTLLEDFKTEYSENK